MARAKPFDDLPRTLEAFERWHARQPERWEFIDGHPVMKAPPALRHTRIKGNLFAALHGSLRGRDCSGYVDGAEIKSERTSSIPDIVVTCGPVDLRGSTITEPVPADGLALSRVRQRVIEGWAARQRARMSKKKEG